MLEQDLQFVEAAFKKYYFEHFDLLSIPNRASEREFGYQKFNGGMNRHISIKSNEELRLMLITNIPSDVYCSNAYYSFPNLPMSEKDWKEADLIFDIDAKDLNLDCRREHTCIKCFSCGEVSVLQSTCPTCKSTKIEKKSLTCKNCIDGAKNEVIKLYTILEEDLDIKKEKIQAYFSGNEGFHVHVTNSPYQQLGSRERNELVDYIMFRGAMPETFGIKKSNPERSSFAEIDEKGWRGRASKHIFGSKSNRSKTISEIIKNNDGYSIVQHRLESLKSIIGVKIDPNVTIDIHRIFRLPGSLNSKSGLSKVLCENIDKFNPFQESCFIDDEKTNVLANCPTQFTLKNRTFGPYKNEKVTIPKYAAIYLICKGLANTILIQD
jgi:DNA primase small subunit